MQVEALLDIFELPAQYKLKESVISAWNTLQTSRIIQ